MLSKSNKMKLKKLRSKGFQVIEINKDKIKVLNEVKKKIYLSLVKYLKLKKKISKKFNKKDINNFYNNFHKIKINESELNELKQQVFNDINKSEKLIDILFNVFEDILKMLFKNNIVGQRKVNLVIHKPNNKVIAPIHRDAPPNSLKEVVIWLPLVDCFKTKSISILDKKFNPYVKKLLKNKSTKYSGLVKYFNKKSSIIDCNYGNALLFKTGNFHYIPLNSENETRFTLNFRFKNLFSVYGSKVYPEYFKIVKSSKNLY